MTGEDELVNEIDLPDVREAAQVEDQLRLAVYEASMYYRPTKITCGHRTREANSG